MEEILTKCHSLVWLKTEMRSSGSLGIPQWLILHLTSSVIVIILLIVLILIFGFGGFRLGPGIGYTAEAASA
jgi:hypothetical protein